MNTSCVTLQSDELDDICIGFKRGTAAEAQICGGRYCEPPTPNVPTQPLRATLSRTWLHR